MASEGTIGNAMRRQQAPILIRAWVKVFIWFSSAIPQLRDPVFISGSNSAALDDGQFLMRRTTPARRDAADPHGESNLVVDIASPNNNNVTHRNLSLQDSTDGDGFSDSLFVRIPYREPIRTLVIADLPEGWRVKTEGIDLGRPFALKPGSEKLLRYFIQPDKPGARGEATFVQYDLTQRSPAVMGGFTVSFGPRKKTDDCKGCDPRRPDRHR